MSRRIAFLCLLLGFAIPLGAPAATPAATLTESRCACRHSCPCERTVKSVCTIGAGCSCGRSHDEAMTAPDARAVMPSASPPLGAPLREPLRFALRGRAALWREPPPHRPPRPL